ncbi:MAG TPA: ABC transporter ATP-binding protein [Euzebyales bacterium]|nr:ABC transporter ATP-binding protein [Euzebyales bacterium]
MVEIALDEVTVVFSGERPEDTVTALDRLTLHVRSGELLTLVGPSGSGKSTLLRTVAGVEEVAAGTITIGDRIVNDLSPRDRDVALVSQYDTLLPHLTVEQNLGFPLSLRKVPSDEASRRVRAEARALGLWPKLRRRPRQLSSGERHKAALGRATARRPQVYLFDEPLAGLDAGERGRVRRELRQLQRGMGVTAVYVTHDQRDAMALGDRVAVLSRGRIVQVDEPMRVWASPADLFVARFFGDPPLGVVEGRLHDDGTTAWIDLSGTALRLHPSQREAVVRRATGAEIAVGVRVGAVSIDEGDPRDAWHRRLPAVVTAIEPLGSSTTVTLEPGRTRGLGHGRLFASVAPSRHIARGAPVAATVDLRRSFVFDVLTGERLNSAQHDTPS